MQFDISRYAPAGIPLLQEVKIFLWGMVLSCLYSTGFLFRYAKAREGLYEMTKTGEKVLIEGAVMPEMTALIHNAFIGFLLVGLLAFAAVFYHYLYHTKDSKSIYLMRRLPNKWELHKRCFTLPCLAVLITLITALSLFLIYYGIYLCFTPKICLPIGSL